jgi:hypothetical protein
MKKAKIFNVIDNNVLPSIAIDNYPEEGEPLEIDKEMYYVCEREFNQEGDIMSIGVIPLVVRNPKKVENIRNYINCLIIAHRRVQFMKASLACDFDDCDEMVIS